MSTEKMCITHTAYKMIFLWIYCAVVFNFQLKMVLTGQITFGPKSIEKWIEAASKRGEGENWFVNSKPGTRLYTNIKQSLDGKEPGESWFVTPTIGKAANLSYINITALSDKCDGKTSCNLTILGNKKPVSALPVLVDRPYITTHFEPIETISFITKNPRQAVTGTVIIKKEYQRLCIITTPTKAETTWSIYSMKLYHNFCDQDGIDKTSLPYTNSSDGNISVTGNCSSNSISIKNKTTIKVKCSPKGNWKVDKDQKCLCKKGFGLGSSKGCSRCLINYYKADVADSECVKCPDGKTNNIMNTKCQCLEHRYIGEDENGPCYAVPSKVEELKIKIRETFVSVSWQKPSDDGGLNDSLTYRVECYRCNQSNCDKEVENATFNPGKTNLITTSVKVYNLTTTERYKVRVVSTNSLNVPSDEWKYAEKEFLFKAPEPLEPTTKSPTLTSKSTSKSTMKTKTSISTILLSVAVSVLVFLLIVLCGVLKYKRRNPGRKDTVELRQSEFIVKQSRNNEEHNYENPDELDVVSHEEVPSVVRMDGNRRDQDLTEVSNLTRSAYYAGVHNAGYLLSVVGETDLSRNVQISEPSAYAKLNNNRQHGRDTENAGDYQKLLKRDLDQIIPDNGETDSCQNEQPIELSTYAKLDRNRKDGKDVENACDYQKLLKSGSSNSERVPYENARTVETTQSY